MDSDHCQVMRDEFQLLDRRNPDQLSNFFLRYKFFSTNDLAQVLSLCSRYIRKLKTRSHFPTNARKTSPKSSIKVPPDIKLEPGYRESAEWWRRHYQKYGSYVLAKATGLSALMVRKHLRKYNIPIRTKRSKPLSHPCCNYEWLYKHYVELKWHSPQCAKAAGVSPDTITSWLNTFKIQVKTRNAPKVGKTWNSAAMGEASCITVRTD